MFLELLLRAVFPSNCFGCGKKTKKDLAICEDCLKSTKINDSFFCGHCHARLPTPNKICHLNTPFILAAATNYRESETVQKIVRHFKFKHGDWVGRTLAKIIYPYAKKILPSENLFVCAVPLAKRRLNERGFNQAQVLADLIAKELNLQIINNGLMRIRDTKPQTLIRGLANRKANLENAFWADQDKVKNKNILLVDDVTTTGATLYSAAKTLKSAGAKKIFALVSAKAG
jgi:ComF family protein